MTPDPCRDDWNMVIATPVEDGKPWKWECSACGAKGTAASLSAAAGEWRKHPRKRKDKETS
jgi:hypothetical protein